LRVEGHRAQLAIGDGAVAITGVAGARGVDSHDSVMVRVDDIDAHHARAGERGARILGPPTDYPYGERQYTAEDPGGHRWTFSQTIADVAPEEWGGTSHTL
jgi:uncharacterized glyoxalase superfamily protein PhnB